MTFSLLVVVLILLHVDCKPLLVISLFACIAICVLIAWASTTLGLYLIGQNFGVVPLIFSLTSVLALAIWLISKLCFKVEE